MDLYWALLIVAIGLKGEMKWNTKIIFGHCYG